MNLHNQKNTKWLYAVVGTLVMLLAGFIYAWSILSVPISTDYPNWSSADLSLAFTICIIFFCLGGFFSGILCIKYSPNLTLGISAVLFLAGFSLASRATTPIALYLSYGVLAGAASGFAYNSIISTIPKHFPNQHGLISGILLMGFGSSSMIIGTLFTQFTAKETGAWRTSFLFVGILLATVIAVSACIIRAPKAATAVTQATTAEDELNFTPREMLRNPRLWLFALWAILSSGIGLSIISQASSMVSSADATVSIERISFVVGLISIANGIGRVIFGALCDRISVTRAMSLALCANLIALVCIFSALHFGSFILVAISFVVLGIGYSGAPIIGASFTRRTFGPRYFAMNLPVLNFHLIPASFAGTIAGILYDSTQSYTSLLFVLFGCVLFAFGSIVFLRKYSAD